MHVVFDTNVFFTDLRMAGPSFEMLFGARVGLTICLPQVVLEEAVAHFGRQFDKYAADVRKLSRLLGQTPPVPERATSEEQKLYREEILRRFSGEGRKVLPLPETTHAVLVTRAVERRRPFQEGGAGYRDALLWDTVTALATEVREPVIFVSNNPKDFADTQGSLHLDLAHDLQALGLSPEDVKLVGRLDDVLATYIRPKLKSLDDMATTLSEETFASFSVRNWVEEELTAYVEGLELSRRRSRRRRDADVVRVVETTVVDEFEVEEVYELPSHAIGLAFNASVESRLEAKFVVEEYDFWSRTGDDYEADGDRPFWRERETRTERFYEYIRYHVRVVLNPSTWKTLSADVHVPS